MKILIDKGYRNYGVQRIIKEGSVLFQKKINDDLAFNFSQRDYKHHEHLNGVMYEFDINLDGVKVGEIDLVLQCDFHTIREEELTEEVIDELERKAMFLYNVFLKGQYSLEVAVMSEVKNDY